MADLYSSSPEMYTERALQFINKYAWLHNFQLTRFYADRIHEKLPEEWYAAFSHDQLSETEFQKKMDNLLFSCIDVHQAEFGVLPDSLRKFLIDTRQLSLGRDLVQYKKNMSPFSRDWMGFNQQPQENECNVSNHLRYGMTPKKHHEVSRLAMFIGNLCRRHGLSSVIDLGSGMGYLDCVLHEDFDLNVLAIESEGVRTKAAEKRAQRWVRPNTASSAKMHHRTLRISDEENNDQELQKIASECGIGNCCVIGLHCCGDLTPRFLDRSASLEKCRALVCVGCCYHLMECQIICNRFKNCPLSAEVHNKVAETLGNNEPLFTIAGLRLATQETKIRWLEEINSYAYGHSFRAILQYAAEEEGFVVKKARRHTSVSEFGSDFNLFMDSVFRNYDIIGCRNVPEFRAVLKRKFLEFEHCFPKIRLFRVLQGLIQGVLESFIVIDRYLYLRNDLRFKFVEICPIFDEDISPRNLALVAVKDS